MDTYLVGGAVRDELLGIPVKDRDWVVVGTTPESMEQAGYKAVGRDFPVFLHPETHEEYALARTERKTGPGYHGFHFDTNVTVSLEDDLLRRDLTINAIAQDSNGNLIDPYNGQQDIKDKVLRHVSPAFAEDPVRVLRIAKFMARFSHLGFSLADSTSQLIKDMVSSGEVDNLVAERIWQEFNAALSYKTPRAFFETLQQSNALERIMPELNAILDSRPALEALDLATQFSDDIAIRFAALCATFNQSEATVVEQFCQRMRAPNTIAELALLSTRFVVQTHEALSLDENQIQALLKSLDVSRRPDRFQQFLAVAKIHALVSNVNIIEAGRNAASEANEANEANENDTRANLKSAVITDNHYRQAEHLDLCAQAMVNIDAAGIAKSLDDKSGIPAAIKLAEISAIKDVLTSSPL